VALVRWAPNTRFHRHRHWGGEEILVLEGLLHDEHGAYPAGSWIRNPHMSLHTPFTQSEGATIWVKVGHLPPEPATLAAWPL
jgi:anti-sigma factor ChrR (cupin superfamily)